MTLAGLTTDNVTAAAPYVVELDRALTPERAFAALAGERHAVFFDSAMRHETLGRYSYVAADPFDWLVVPADGSDALGPWSERLNQHRAERRPDLPPWQGGAAGVLGYEIGRSLERLPRPRHDEFGFPALAMGLYDGVIAFDHQENRVWAIAHGFSASEPPCEHRAAERIDWLTARLDRPAKRPAQARTERLDLERMAPHFVTLHEGVVSNFSRDAYLRAVERVIEHLRAGDAFQVNLSQRLLTPDGGDPIGAYLRLRERNPAPFGGYLDGGDWRIVSASPERFLRVEDGLVETRPIKGTRPLGEAAAADLLGSEKDRAENVMIVDLLRNDLAWVCEDASVAAPTLFGLEPYAHVQHLVSVVTGRLRRECGVADLLAATLPGGSITGAPKVRAQEIIADLEPTARGAYCGSLAWVGWPDASGRQAMDSSILIRTLTHSHGWTQAPVGGGVTVRSDPEAEYAETWHKAAGLLESAVGSRR